LTKLLDRGTLNRMSQPDKDTARERFVKACLERDGKGCRACSNGAGTTGDLQVHQITEDGTMPYGGHALENGITLCGRCRRDAEVFHASGGVDFIQGFHPHDLYMRLGVSFQAAYAACIRSGARSEKVGRLSVYYGDDGKPVVASLKRSTKPFVAARKTLEYVYGCHENADVLVGYDSQGVVGLEIMDPLMGQGELNKILKSLSIMDLSASEKKALRGEAITETE
jgi:hypothetical protein